MKDYDAKDASLNIGGQEIYGFGDDKYYARVIRTHGKRLWFSSGM